MRERIAVSVAALVVAVLVGLSVLFARAQNPRVVAAGASPGGEAVAVPTASPSPEPPPSADSIRGRVVFDSAGCAGCHSVAGVGNPRNPLDGVGSRRTDAALRAWTQGADVLADSLPPSALRAKQSYRALKPADLDALVAYLKSLKGR